MRNTGNAADVANFVGIVSNIVHSAKIANVVNKLEKE